MKMNYPNSINKEYHKVISHANRGMDLEAIINETNEYLREKLSVSRNTAGKYLSELEELGVLTSEQVGKEKIYKNNYLYDLIKEW